MDPLVSVIIPSFNRFDNLLNAIKSVSDQSYENIEVIIINDGSSDERYKNNTFGDFVKLINLDRNSVQTKGYFSDSIRNYGIEESNGKYIAFIDADDTWAPDKLKDQISFMKKNNYQMSHTSYYIINQKKKIIGQRKARNLMSVDEILKSCDIGLSTVVIEKKVITKTTTKFPQLVTKEDFVFWLTLLKKNYKFYAFDNNLTNWTDSKNSLSSSTAQKLFDGFKVYYYYMNFNVVKSLYYLICLSLNYLKKK